MGAGRRSVWVSTLRRRTPRKPGTSRRRVMREALGHTRSYTGQRSSTCGSRVCPTVTRPPSCIRHRGQGRRRQPGRDRIGRGRRGPVVSLDDSTMPSDNAITVQDAKRIRYRPDPSSSKTTSTTRTAGPACSTTPPSHTGPSTTAPSTCSVTGSSTSIPMPGSTSTSTAVATPAARSCRRRPSP